MIRVAHRKLFRMCLQVLKKKIMWIIVMMVLVMLTELATDKKMYCQQPNWYGNHVLTAMLMEHGEPSNYKEAMEGPESEKWLEPMISELGSMYENKEWTSVDSPNDRKAVEN